MKKYLLLSFIIITGFSISDTRKNLRFIEWKADSYLYINNVSKKVLNFHDAEYPDQASLLPYYFESAFIETDHEVGLRVINPVYEPLVPDSEMQGLDQVGSELNFKSSILNSAGQKILQFKFLPIIREGNNFKRIVSFELEQYNLPVKKSAVVPYIWKDQSVLKSGNWVKIKTSGKGIYRITYDKLKQWGFSDPGNVNLFGNSEYMLSEDNSSPEVDDLKQMRVMTGKDKQGKDCIFFYSSGTTKWTLNQQTGKFEHKTNPYSEYSYFFLTDGSGKTLQVETLAPVTQNPNKTVSSFDEYQLHEVEKYNLIRSGKTWYGDKFIPIMTNPVTIKFNLSNRDSSSPVSLVLTAIVRAAGNSTLDIASGTSTSTIGSLFFEKIETDNSYDNYANQNILVKSINPTGSELNLILALNSSVSNAEGWVDFALINFRKKLRIDSNELFFRDKSSLGKGTVAEFTLENGSASRILDVTDPAYVSEIPVIVSGNNLKFIRPNEILTEYVAFNQSEIFPEPDLVGKISNQNLHGLKDCEMVIITHPNFVSAATKLAEFHINNDGLSVNMVQSEEVYNEFGSGSPDATSIRNFIKMLYSRSKKLKYVLLFGDGSYDNRNILKKNRNFIVTYQSENSLLPTSSFVTDDYYAILDDGESVFSGAEDVGIGRLPVSSELEAQIVLNKIINYSSEDALGDWRNVISFISDDADIYSDEIFVSQSEELADSIGASHHEYMTNKIYFDSYVQKTSSGGESYPDVTDAISKKVNKGVLILNYIGHANPRFLASEKVLDVSSINSWANSFNLPIFVTATCEFSRFDDDDMSAGEYILLNPNGGGIGLFSTTRSVYASDNFILSRNFYRIVFNKDSNGERYRMGEIMRLAKISTFSAINNRSFTLLADPALRLSYPKNQVYTSGIRKNNVQLGNGTLTALDKVTIDGYLVDFNGNKLSGFQGKIIPVVYDKAILQKTLGNNGANSFEFKWQENVIYKGLASVKSGEFSFSFIVPKDISSNAGRGKILYYAYPDKGTDDANGAFESFLIGGSSNIQILDNQAPAIEAYLNDTNFKNGDRTSRNPLLLANISDENGINTVGNGIGHDITATLDNDLSNVYVLNSFFKTNIDDFKSGVIEYQFKNLSVGEHTLKLKVWDVANNSTEIEIKFIVTGDLNIEVSNYPNPVVGYTNFSFKHNQPDAVFNFILEIFDRSGRRIDLIRQKVSSVGLISVPVRWDRSRTNAADGLYSYRIAVQSSDGTVAMGSGKMLLLKQ